MTFVARAKLIPFAILLLAALALLKSANVYLGFSTVGAAEDAAVEVASSETEQPQSSSSRETTIEAAPEHRDSVVEKRILGRLAERRAALDAREQELETRAAVLAALEKKLAERFRELEVARSAVELRTQQQEEAKSEQVVALVSAYERMKAKDAARIFDSLNETLLAQIASGMRTQALAGVLAEMQPEKARRLTLMIADQDEPVADAPTTE